jgi:hypothetical protein
MDLKLHVGDNILKFHALHAHIRPRTRCHKLPLLSVGFVSAALNLDPKTYHKANFALWRDEVRIVIFDDPPRTRGGNVPSFVSLNFTVHIYGDTKDTVLWH